MADLRQYNTLITSAEVISRSFTNANTDPYLISENILVISELAHIKHILGKEFYGELKKQHNDGTLTTDNTTFLNNYLLDTLAWFVRFEVINEIQMNSSSAGVVTNIDEFSSVVSPDELNAYKQDTYRKAEIFLRDAVDFLNDDDQNGKYSTYESNKPCTGNTWKNHGIIMYDSIYENPRVYRSYDSWKNFCPCDDC